MPKFDLNNLDRLQALISLKRRCLFWENISRPFSNGTFFSDFSDEIDIPLLFIINDELTNSTHRSGIIELIDECIKKNRYYNYIELEHGDNNTLLVEDDLKETFVSQADKLIHMVLTRFFINAFSVFEYWMCKSYDAIKEKHDSKNSRLSDLEVRLERYVALKNEHDKEPTNEKDNKLTDLKMEIFKKTNAYVSSREKIDFILSKINYTALSDKDKCKKAKELVRFLFSLRNTIHNIGINKSGKDFSIEINDTIVELPNNKSPNYHNYAKFIDSWHLIIDLYSDLFMYLGSNHPNFHLVVNES